LKKRTILSICHLEHFPFYKLIFFSTLKKIAIIYKSLYIINNKLYNKLSGGKNLMADSIILLEERKEVTTFLLDEGTITATTVTTPTGETPGYEYAGDKVKVDDAVTLSENSDIGKPTVKKYTAAEGEIILGIAVNDPVTMTGGRRKTSILVLGHLFRLKLASGLSNINVNDRIALTSTGAIKSDDGEYIAMHPVASSDDYNYIEVFRPYDIGEA